MIDGELSTDGTEGTDERRRSVNKTARKALKKDRTLSRDERRENEKTVLMLRARAKIT
jgi:hypothetical protein